VRLGLVDEIRLSVTPVLLGNGVSLFGNPGLGSALHLRDITAFRTGIVELWYDVVRNPLREDS
jgi:riboflavin biosynthesis pyrimidine reductase